MMKTDEDGVNWIRSERLSYQIVPAETTYKGDAFAVVILMGDTIVHSSGGFCSEKMAKYAIGELSMNGVSCE